MKLYIYLLQKRRKYKNRKYLAPYHYMFFIAKNDEDADKKVEESVEKVFSYIFHRK